jgi:hypothetical protein
VFAAKDVSRLFFASRMRGFTVIRARPCDYPGNRNTTALADLGGVFESE